MNTMRGVSLARASRAFRSWAAASVGPLLLLPEGFIGLPEPIHFGAVRLAIADPVAAVSDGINGGPAGGGTNAADERHWNRADGFGLGLPVILPSGEFHFDISPAG